jgi:hypothetical protein
MAAQAALDKAKAEAEPLEWCEREKGDIVQDGDEVSDMRKEFDLQALGYACRDASDSWTKARGWLGYSVGKVTCCGYIVRARYRNPLWLAKHGKAVESHETPVGETQAKEVVTDETQHSPSRTLSDAEFKKLVGRMSLPQLYDALKANGVKLEGIGLEPKKVDEQSVLEEAAKCVTGPRRRDYGTPDENFGRIAEHWNTHLKDKLSKPITTSDVAMMMILLKVAREANSPKRDNYVDIAGYAQCAGELGCYIRAVKGEGK